MNFTHRNKRSSFLIRDILRVSKDPVLLVNTEIPATTEQLLLNDKPRIRSPVVRNRPASSASSTSSPPHQQLLSHRDDGLMRMMATSPSGDCFATGGSGSHQPHPQPHHTSLPSVDAYLTSVRIPSSSRFPYFFPASSLIPPSSFPNPAATSSDHHHPFHAHSSDQSVHHRVHSSSSTSSSPSSSTTSLILPPPMPPIITNAAASVAATSSSSSFPTAAAATTTTQTTGFPNWSSPFSSVSAAAAAAAAVATCIPCFTSVPPSVAGMFPRSSSPTSSHSHSGTASTADHLHHHHHHLLLHRNHLEARNQQVAAGHVYRLDSPPASSFELMTVDDDDDDIVCDGMAPDSHSDEGRESISRSASPSALITSAGNKSRSSISITGSGIRHQHHWQHQALHQSHEQHYHSYPGKEHQTRRIPAHQDGGSGGGDHDPGEDAASTAGVDMHDECNSRKIRRNRTVFTELQLMGLERRFDSQKYLSTPDRADLARVLGLTQLQVKTWYQNRRMKWKKQVMQAGCLIPPTKPKGRPKKNSIPSLGIMDSSLLFCSTLVQAT